LITKNYFILLIEKSLPVFKFLLEITVLPCLCFCLPL